MTISGKVVHISETEVFGSGFQKRFLVVEAADGNYTNNYGVQAFKDSVSKFDGFSAGDEVEIEVFDNSVGKVREYESKWYSDMPTCMKISKVSGATNVVDNPAEEDDYDDSVPF